MNVRFENLKEKCEKCGKPGNWRCYGLAVEYLAKPVKVKVFCDDCYEAEKKHDK